MSLLQLVSIHHIEYTIHSKLIKSVCPFPSPLPRPPLSPSPSLPLPLSVSLFTDIAIFFCHFYNRNKRLWASLQFCIIYKWTVCVLLFEQIAILYHPSISYCTLVLHIDSFIQFYIFYDVKANILFFAFFNSHFACCLPRSTTLTDSHTHTNTMIEMTIWDIVQNV